MRNIPELIVLFRAEPELPVGLKLKTDSFREGWSFVRSASASRLEKKIRMHQWHFIRITARVLQSGVGESSQQAIVCALRLALRSVSEYFNAVEIRRIHLTAYPWFVLAGVEVYPIRIQQSAVLAVSDNALPLPAFVRKTRPPLSAPWLSSRNSHATPVLKEMPVSSARTHGGLQ